MLKTVMLLNIIGNYDNFFFFMNRKLKRIAGIFSDINVCIAFDQIVTSMLKKNITFFLSENPNFRTIVFIYVREVILQTKILFVDIFVKILLKLLPPQDIMYLFTYVCYAKSFSLMSDFYYACIFSALFNMQKAGQAHIS